MTWKTIIETACEAANCTPLQARRAWKAASEVFGFQSGEITSWIIAGMGTLEIKAGRIGDKWIPGKPTGTPSQYVWFMQLGSYSGYSAPTTGDIASWPDVAGSIFESPTGVVDTCSPANMDAGQTFFPGVGLWGWTTTTTNTPPPIDETTMGTMRRMKVRLSTHKGVIARNRAGTI
jgi:hypothetical protein